MKIRTKNRCRFNGKTFEPKKQNIITMAAVQQLLATYMSTAVAPGQVAYTTAGTYSWTCPAGVTSVCVLCVGRGESSIGGGGGSAPAGRGGALSWGNNIPVTPGNSYTVVVGGTNSYFIDTATLYAGVSNSVGGSYRGGGGFGGSYNPVNDNLTEGGGGGGAAGYSGNGGNGGGSTTGQTAGAGGGGGGGNGGFGSWGGGGGGVGLLGQGSNGAAGGGAGSGGTAGAAFNTSGTGGAYGGGGAGGFGTSTPGAGAVRIIWGAGRSFPSTNTGNL